MSAKDFLVEIGTEELPPKALRSLMDAFAENLTAGVDDAHLPHGAVHAYASPRRLAVLIEALADSQRARTSTQKGPPVAVAFDKDGQPQAAAIAFAKKCGVAVSELGRESTDKGEWLTASLHEHGRSSAELLPELVTTALAKLPIPRRMRWGDNDAEFVRPVHWIVMLHGTDVVDANIFGIRSANISRGHRFHSSGAVTIDKASDYLAALENEGHVIADFLRRRELVVAGVADAAAAAGGVIVDGESLYDEVTALVEWPVPILGSFDAAYLELPKEVVISTLTGHQRYFPVADVRGKLLPLFVTVANIESTDPDQVRDGNERVIRPRLADAAFFWSSDRKRSLASRSEQLRDVVYQRGLGSLHDRALRIASIGEAICAQLSQPADTVERAALLAKCDLLTDMVGEFPELQGLMGQYYATADGEPEALARAIGEQYLPRYAGDALPGSGAGQVLAIADKLDIIAGIFVTGKKPSGNRDPFGLRRAALGIVRIIIEGELELDLKELIAIAITAQPAGKRDIAELNDEFYAFIAERLRGYSKDRDAELTTETFDAVLVREPRSLLDFARRLDAVQAFTKLDEAASLAAANKRIANILKKSGLDEVPEVQDKLLVDAAEVALAAAISAAHETVRPLLASAQYTGALTALAALRGPVDKFFDEVLVMADDTALRDNRLALLGRLRRLFLEVADISRLVVGD
ncbi:MAG TPA: glycine--tRNA ligase subunit beta [Woeseiaceae bacterium]|nr:glycine--tRNA ligase subunit beta [Woeseiaceae bacterium]